MSFSFSLKKISILEEFALLSIAKYPVSTNNPDLVDS